MTLRWIAPLLGLALLSGCGQDAKKPSAADIAAYLAQSEPEYLQVSGVSPRFEALKQLSGKDVPAGSWRVTVTFNLHATQELYAPQPGAREARAEFQHTVAAFELMRVARIQAAEQLAARVGLMKKGDVAPEPAVPVVVTTHAKQDLSDSVVLLAQPEGARWNFVQMGAQALSDEAIGIPLADLRANNPHAVFVVAGTDEDRSYRDRAERYLAALAKAGAQP